MMRSAFDDDDDDDDALDEARKRLCHVVEAKLVKQRVDGSSLVAAVDLVTDKRNVTCRYARDLI